MVGCLGIDFALIEKVTGDNNEVDSPFDCVTLEHFAPGSKEVKSPVGQVVPPYPQMNVGYVKESRHLLTLQSFGSPWTNPELPTLSFGRVGFRRPDLIEPFGANNPWISLYRARAGWQTAIRQKRKLWYTSELPSTI
jgi:hypothetical protein